MASFPGLYSERKGQLTDFFKCVYRKWTIFVDISRCKIACSVGVTKLISVTGR